MKLVKTHNDLQLLRQLSPMKIGWSEMLAVMMDIFLDARDESGRELDEMEFSNEAFSQWRSLANTLLSAPMQSAILGMPERSRKRIEAYREQLEEYNDAAQGVQKELKAYADEEACLRGKIRENEQTLERLKLSKKTIAELSEHNEALRQEIDGIKDVDADELRRMEAQLMHEREVRKKRQEEYDRVYGELNQLNAENNMLNAEIETMEKKISSVRQSNSEAEAKRAADKLELEKLNYSLDTLQITVRNIDSETESLKTAIKNCNETIVDKKVELKDLQSRLAVEEASMHNTQEQVLSAKSDRDELLVQRHQLQSELDGIISQISELQSEIPGLKKRIEEQKIKLKEEENLKDEETQQLSREVSELNQKVGEANARIGSLTTEKKLVQEKLDAVEKSAKDIEAVIENLKQEIDELNQRRNKLDSDKETLLHKKVLYENDISEYERFFDSGQCRQTREMIERYGMIIDEYRSAISMLFHTKVGIYVDQLPELDESYRMMREQLSGELRELQRQYEQLSSDYLYIIKSVEERVKL